MFAALYHAHHSRYTADLPFWAGLARSASGPVLELGCGTGRVSVALARAGCQVYGLDNDMEMLLFCHSLLKAGEQEKVHLFGADMRQFHLAGQFRLIILPCNTLSTLSRDDLSLTLACSARHLDKGGIFAASLPNPHLLLNQPPRSEPELEEIIPHPLDGAPVQISSGWERTERHFKVSWYYAHSLPDGQFEQVQIEVKHELLSSQDYLDALQRAGFNPIQTFGNFNQARYRKASPHLILVARKAF